MRLFGPGEGTITTGDEVFNSIASFIWGRCSGPSNSPRDLESTGTGGLNGLDLTSRRLTENLRHYSTLRCTTLFISFGRAGGDKSQLPRPEGRGL